jgi:hypothetical protein
MRSRLIWWLLTVGLAANEAPPARPAVPVDKRVRIQPIQVCSDDGLDRANTNLVLFREETAKIWAQAGLNIEFLPWLEFRSSLFLTIEAAVGYPNSFMKLAGDPGHAQHPDPTVINLWFVKSISGGPYFGLSQQTIPNGADRNGIAIANLSFPERRDVIAHELGHNLGLNHTTFGASGETNLMSVSRQVPATASDIFPDGAGLDHLNASQIAQARSTSFTPTIDAPVITQQPISQMVKTGSSGFFTVSVQSPTPHFLQWFFNETNLLAGATHAMLALTNVQAANGGSYHVVITNSSSSVTSDVAVLVVEDADTDGDGIPGGWEWAHGLNPHFAEDALWDLDGDTMINLHEFVAGTDPNDARSCLKVEILASSGNNDVLRITFQGNQGKSYTVQWLDSLDQGRWQTLANIGSLQSDAPIAVTDPSARTKRQSWYRVVTPAQN